MTQLGLPFYAIDENISPSFARALAAAGFKVTSIVEAFGGRKGVSEEEIIPWLSEKGAKNAVWVTKDWQAQKVHAKLIHEQCVSVLWLLIPDHGLRALRELQLLVLVIEHVTTAVLESRTPVYLRASFNVRRPRLEQIANPVTEKVLSFQRIHLPR